MTSPIQIPTLRPTDVVREPGLDQPQGELPALARLLMAKGQLALEQEKFQNEVGQQKQKKATLDQLHQGLSQIFSQMPQTPEGTMGAFQQAIPMIGGAGENVGPLMSQLPEMQKQVTGAHVTSALSTIISEFAQTEMRDPLNQAEFLSHVAQVAPDHMTAAADILKPLQGTVAFHNVKGVGLWAGNPQLKTDAEGNFVPPQGKIIVPEVSADPATKARQQGVAILNLQRITNLEHIMQADSQANVEPTQAAGAENLAKSGTAQAIIGGLGSLGIGAGTPKAIAQTKRSPAQQRFRLNAAGFVHTYLTFIGGSPRSNILYEKVYDSFFPGAGATKEALAEGWNDIQEVKGVMQDAAAGKRMDPTRVSKLPFFHEVQALEAAAGGAGQAQPESGEPEEPLSPESLLNGVPPQ